MQVASNVLLLYGGISAERRVSCVSAKLIYDTLTAEGFKLLPVYIDNNNIWHKQATVSININKQAKKPCFLHKKKTNVLSLSDGSYEEFDIAFPIIHGPTGEDGRLQGFFDFLNLPYVGAGVLTSAICMDKYYSKTLFKQFGLSVLTFMKIDLSDWKDWPNQIAKEVLKEFSFPFFIKPCNMGSSIGISKVNSISEFEKGVNKAFMYDDQVLIEEARNVRELEIAITGNRPNYKITEIGEIIVHSDFYSYESKYLKNTSELKIPADITKEQKNIIRDTATAAFRLVNGDGFARIDFFLDVDSQKIYLNEINTLPGFTPISMFPKLWEHSGMSPNILIPYLVQLGFEKHTKKTLEASIYTRLGHNLP